MPEPTRPEPDLRLSDRVRAAADGWFRRETAGLAALVLIGTALLVGGGIWGVRAWSQRSAPPIDDLLPVLVAGDPTVAPAAEPIATASEPETVDALPTATAAPTAILVHVSGAVRLPGVVEVMAGARVYVAVAAAGGETDDADLDRLNLAAPLVDGERIHVPAVGEGEPPTLIEPDRPASSAADVTPEAETLQVDLNRATVAELEQLPGVGPTIAAAIVALRDARGPYAHVDELLLVDGIGPAKLDALRPMVWVRPG